jgi:hypothetical protein
MLTDCFNNQIRRRLRTILQYCAQRRMTVPHKTPAVHLVAGSVPSPESYGEVSGTNPAYRFTCALLAAREVDREGLAINK